MKIHKSRYWSVTWGVVPELISYCGKVIVPAYYYTDRFSKEWKNVTCKSCKKIGGRR